MYRVACDPKWQWARRFDTLGWSHMRLYEIEVPEPGGIYHVVVTGEVADRRAHLVLED